MRAVALLAALLAVTSGSARRWELVPTWDGGLTLADVDASLLDLEVDPGEVHFLLFTRSNPTDAEELTIGSTDTGNFVASKPTKFLTHGWHNAASDMSPIRDAWLSAGDYNVIVMDWSSYAKSLDYAYSKRAVKGVGVVAANFGDWLVSVGADTGDMEFVGHSLGAHVCGVAGNRISSGRIARITGLDPAAPLYDVTSIENRLDASDADFVQVIHTDGSSLGLYDPLGTADFYPNGGESQPGCGLDVGGACSHGRSTEFFTESITAAVGFTGTQCESWEDYENGSCDGNPTALMGETLATSASGSYYLHTAESAPYALG